MGVTPTSRSPVHRVHVRPSRFEGGYVTKADAVGRHIDSFTFRAKMDIDSDGGRGITLRQDPWHQNDTSLHLGGRPVDATKIPYVVLPPPLAQATGAKLGDLVRVQYKGKTVYAIYADNGPSAKLGEGSMALARMVGINPDPKNGGLQSPGVRYTVLTGTARLVKGLGHAPTRKQIEQIGAEAFARAQAKGLLK